MNFQQTAIEYVTGIGFRPVASHQKRVQELMFQKGARRIGISYYGASFYVQDEERDWNLNSQFEVPQAMGEQDRIVFLFAGIGAIPVAELNRERMKEAPSLSRQNIAV